MADKFVIQTNPPSESVKKVAAEELRETPEVVASAIQELRKLIKEDGKIEINDDDDLLTVFLRPCKFYPTSALELIRRVLEFKQKNAELLEGLTPDKLKDVIAKTDVVNVLVDRDQKGRRVLIVKSGSSWDPKQVNTDQIFQIFYLIHLAAMLEPETQINGVIVIMDFDGLGMKQIKGMSPTFSMRLLTFIQEAMPLRLKEVHIVKQPFLFNMVWTLFKPFIKEKLKNRLYFHGTKMNALHEYVPPTHLPEDYGGKLPKINYSGKDWYKAIDSVSDHINKWNTFRILQ